MNAFKPTFKNLRSDLKRMLVDGIHFVEEGFTILDVDLEIDENLTVDVIAKDAKGHPTVVLLAEEGETNLIHRILTTVCGLRKNRMLLKRLYLEHSFDFSVPPRMLLLSSRFSDDFIEELDFIVAGDIVPFEYSSLKIKDKEFLAFSRRDIEEGGEARAFQIEKPSGPGREEDLIPPKKIDKESMPVPKSAPAPAPSSDSKAGKGSGATHKKMGVSRGHDKFFHDAKKKILRISNDIIEAVDGNISRFKINDKVLVTLSTENSKLFFFLGDIDEKRLEIKSENHLNEALNLVFKRYFTTFGTVSKS